MEVIDRIKLQTHFGVGNLPVRYLGVPLSSKKLHLIHYMPLIDKITNRIKHWSHKLLSIAGRMLLVKSIFLATTQYWMLCFPLPKAVIHKIEAICRAFVWTGKDKGRKSPVAWQQVCRPIKQGGMDIINMGIWNQVALLKCLWNIANKMDNLWVKWVHLYYLKRNSIWNAPIPSNCTWIMKSIFDRRSDVLEHQQAWQMMQTTGKFSMKRMYEKLVPAVPTVNWSSLIQHNHARPRAVVCLWLACQDRLATKVRLKRIGILQNELCSFCNDAPEDFNHLLIECRICSVVWKNVLQWLQVRHVSCNWMEEITWLTSNTRGKGFMQNMLKLSIAETVYGLWIYRNANIFDRDNVDNTDSVARKIVDMIIQRGWMKPKHRDKLALLML